MALIKCIECAKMFSDKAVYCPECGCPTELVVKATQSPEKKEAQAQSSKQAADTIFKEVAEIKNQFKNAQIHYEMEYEHIKQQAERRMTLFEDDITSRVIQSCSDMRKACEELYSTCQTAVVTLDVFCRPFLKYSPDGKAIKAVLDLIKILNDESDIDIDFSVDFNGSSLGNIGVLRYLPSVSCKMIQKFWETQYSSSPCAVEFEKQRRIQIAEDRRIREEEKKRKEAELVAAKKHYDEVLVEVERLIASYQADLNSEINNQIDHLKKQIGEIVNSFIAQKTELQIQLQSLGHFSFSKKRHLSEQIETLELKIEKLQNKSFVEPERKTMQDIAEQAVRSYRKEINAYLNNRFPDRNAIKKHSTQNPYVETLGFRAPYPSPVHPALVFENYKI